MTVQVTRFDNRGTPDDPFGFVYFDAEEVRVGYSNGAVWQANWGQATGAHFAAAHAVLHERGVLGYEDPGVVKLQTSVSEDEVIVTTPAGLAAADKIAKLGRVVK